MSEIAREPRQTGRARDTARRILRHENANLLFVLIALIFGMGAVTGGVSLGRTNAVNIVLQSSIRGIASIGQAFVILTAGLDLSVGGIGLLACTVGASMITEAPHLSIVAQPVPLAVGVIVMMVVGASVGLVNGTLVSRVGMPGLIVTLGMWQILKGLGYAVGSGATITYLPESLLALGQGRLAGVPVPSIVFIVVAVVGYLILNYTSFGRFAYAVGGNPVSSWLSGVNVKKTQLMVYMVSGLLAGVAGVATLGRSAHASMRTLMGLEIDTISAVAIGGVSLMGGRGNLIGVVIGVLILGVINNGMTILGAGPGAEGVVKGAIIIVAVAIDCIRRVR